MRIPFPKTIPLRPLLVILTIILCIQLIEGTDPAFAVLMLVAQLAAAITFNHLGGMTHMAGAFCLFAILPAVTVPEISHLFLGQSGDFKMVHPLTTAGVCAVFFVCVMISGLLVSSMSHPVAFLDHIRFSILELRIVSALSCVFAIYIAFEMLTLKTPVEDGSLQAALNHFYPLLLAISIMMATYVRIATTDGESVMNWYIAFLLILAIVPGIMSASKEGMLTPLLCWIVVVASSRHRFSWFGILGLAAGLYVVLIFVYPFSQNARFLVRTAATLSERTSIIIEFIRDPSQFPDFISEESGESSGFGPSSSKVNIIARYSVLQSIDMLIDADQRLGYTSIERYTPVLVSVVPHAIWPNRPAPITSNELGHKAGFAMDANDTTTGIAIGSPALFFDLGGWLALIVYTLLSFTIFFLVTVRIVGSSFGSIWGLVITGTEANLAGNCSVSDMFNLTVTFIGAFFLVIAFLKLISYVTEALVSRPISTKA